MIYALLDWDLLQKFNISIEQFINKCYQLDVKIIQYRDKHSKIKNIKERIKQIRTLWTRTLIVNDYISLIEFADGLHIGQEDLKRYGSISKIRTKIDNRILGLSTHNKREILRANELDVDYIGLGAYRTTSTKKGLKSPLGKKRISELIHFSIHPVAVIGGVKLKDIIPNATYMVIGSDICKSISTQ
jgi:thiamine-phosphate pyrophosphorylase